MGGVATGRSGRPAIGEAADPAGALACARAVAPLGATGDRVVAMLAAGAAPHRRAATTDTTPCHRRGRACGGACARVRRPGLAASRARRHRAPRGPRSVLLGAGEGRVRIPRRRGRTHSPASTHSACQHAPMHPHDASSRACVAGVDRESVWPDVVMAVTSRCRHGGHVTSPRRVSPARLPDHRCPVAYDRRRLPRNAAVRVCASLPVLLFRSPTVGCSVPSGRSFWAGARSPGRLHSFQTAGTRGSGE